MRSDVRGYPRWPGAVCSTQGPDTEEQDQSLPLCRFSLQRTAGPHRWVTSRNTHDQQITAALPPRGELNEACQIRRKGQTRKTAHTYSFNSSASATKVGRSSMPLALAVFRLITSADADQFPSATNRNQSAWSASQLSKVSSNPCEELRDLAAGFLQPL